MRVVNFKVLTISIGAMLSLALACSNTETTPTPLPTIQSHFPTVMPARAANPTPTTSPTPLSLESELPSYMTRGWNTDFSIHSVDYSEIVPASLPKDGIPAIDNPKFHEVSEAPDYVTDSEPVISLEINGEARAYPLSILVRHEIVNDEVNGMPVMVSYCPLCNTAIVFDRVVDGEILDFGVTGNLRFSDLLMWDRQTESWWQQITGEAIVGEYTGTRLEFIPSQLISWQEFREAFPDGKLLSRDTGFDRDYDIGAYRGYDGPSSYPRLFKRGTWDFRLPSLERVLGLTLGEKPIAYTFSYLQEHVIINDSYDGTDIAIFYASDTLSPFPGEETNDRRVIGSTAVFNPEVDGQKLMFEVLDGLITDRNTGSTWNMLGHALSGPMEGVQLTPVIHGNHFWFAWSQFNPETIIIGAEAVESAFPLPTGKSSEGN